MYLVTVLKDLKYCVNSITIRILKNTNVKFNTFRGDKLCVRFMGIVELAHKSNR